MSTKDGSTSEVQSPVTVAKSSKRKWIIIALAALLPWLAVAGCNLKQSAGFNTGFIPSPVTKTVKTTVLPTIIVPAPAPKRAVRHRPVVKAVQPVQPEPACKPLDLICAVIVAGK